MGGFLDKLGLYVAECRRKAASGRKGVGLFDIKSVDRVLNARIDEGGG